MFAAEPGDALALGIDDGQARPEIGHLEIDGHAWAELADDEGRMLAAAAMQRAGAVQVVPLRLVLAVAIEHLHAMVLAVSHIDPAVGIGRDVVDDVELAGIGAGLAPGLEQFAVRRVFVHAGIAIAVGDVDFAFRRQRGVGAAVERLAAHVRRRLVRNADRQQHLAVGAAFAHGVVAVVGAIEIVVGVDVQAMGAAKQAFAPACDEIAVAVEHDNRMVAAVEDVDAVLAVDRDGGDVGEPPPLRQLCPILHHAVAMFARAESGRHVFLPGVSLVGEECCRDLNEARGGAGAGRL